MDESRTIRPRLDGFDWSFLGVIVALTSIGVLTLYSVTGEQAGTALPIYWKQAVWVGVGSLAFLAASAIDYREFARWSYLLYGAGLLLLAVVAVSGKSVRGAQRWLALGPVAIQPSEFVKIPVLFVLAAYYSVHTQHGWWRRVIMPGLFVLPVFVLVLRQPDLGSSLSVLAIYVTLLLAVGVKSRTFGLVLMTTLMIFPFVWSGVWGSLHDYQQERILSFVDPAYDPGGQGYQGLQSRIAVGSGELIGKGVSGETQTRFRFLPAGHTDFVFAVFAEEWGFLGSLLLIGLFLALALLGLDIAAKARDLLGALLAVGIVGMIVFNMAVNVGMTIGLMPIVGIPLPLLSYGGSATIMTMAALGLLFNIKKSSQTAWP